VVSSSEASLPMPPASYHRSEPPGVLNKLCAPPALSAPKALAAMLSPPEKKGKKTHMHECLFKYIGSRAHLKGLALKGLKEAVRREGDH